MKQIMIMIAACFSIWTAAAQKKWVEDGNVELREVKGPFNEIRVSGGILLYLSQSDEEKVAVSASDEKLLQGIRTVVTDQTLHISYQGDRNVFKKARRLTVYVSCKELSKLEASGATDIRAEDVLRGAELSIRLSGASDFAGAVQVKKLNLDMSGASDIRISGKSEDLVIHSSGASDVKGYELESDQCEARASGASDIQVTVMKILKANASGASSIHYKGTGVISDIHTSGASSVAKKDN